MTGFASRHPLAALVLQRIGISVALLLAMSLLIFAGTELLPGDVAQSVLGQSATPEALANMRHELGLDQPAAKRYLTWLAGLVQGDLGTSLSGRQSISEMISGRLGNTLFLAALSALISVPLAVLLGLIAVLYRGGLVTSSFPC